MVRRSARAISDVDSRKKPITFGRNVRHHWLNFQLSWANRLRLRGSNRDQGIALPVSIIASFVLVIGVVALSSRSNQGFFASIFQGVNREARDIAESAIADFGVTMNREENRLLLVAGNDSSWISDEHRNVCTSSSKKADGTWSAVSDDPVTAVSASTPTSANRFIRTGDWVPLIAGDTTRLFKVTKVEYYFEDNMNRTPFDFDTPSINFPGKTVRQTALEGGTRTLLRVTVVGRVDRNGQSSYARVAREFEVVPKCCKRSFGNNSGSIPWGRDNIKCPVGKGTGGGTNGIIGSLNGGSPSGSNNELDIRDENNQLVKQALCWTGNVSGESSDLAGEPNEECENGTQSLGKATKTKSSVQFVPAEFSLKLPSPAWGTSTLAASPNYSSTTRIYLDPATDKVMQKIGSSPATQMTNCIVNPVSSAPYRVVDCRFSKITSGNNDVFIDTSYAMINFHFDDLSVTGEYMGGGGNTSYKRVHCSRTSWTATCSDLVTWTDFRIKCDIVLGSDPNCSTGKNSSFDHSELFNVFTLGAGKFNLNGTSSAVGLNIYAPFATVTLKGGGSADPNFMGRLWADNISLNGNVKLNVPNSLPSFCSSGSCPPPSTVPLFDLVARSFSHASGF